MLRVLDVETSSLRSVPCSRFAEPRDRAAQISLRLCWRTLGQRRRRPGSLYLRCARCSPSTGNDVVVKQGRVLTLRIDAPRERPVAQALQARMTKEGAAVDGSPRHDSAESVCLEQSVRRCPYRFLLSDSPFNGTLSTDAVATRGEYCSVQ